MPKQIPNSHNKIKTLWGVINKESGRNKKRSEIQALNVEGRKIIVQQILLKLLKEYFVAIAENVKRQSKNILIYDDDKRFIVSH